MLSCQTRLVWRSRLGQFLHKRPAQFHATDVHSGAQWDNDERRTHTYTYCENARTHKVDLESPKRVSEAKCCDKVVSEFVPRDRLKKPLSWRVSLFNLLGPVSRGESRSNGAKREDNDECTYTKTTERLA